MKSFKRDAEVFKALGDENRLKILDMLRGGELSACKLLEELGIGQPTLSHHMKILCSIGLVRGRKEGRWVHYSIDPEGRVAWLRRFVELTDMEEHSILCACRDRKEQNEDDGESEAV